MSTDQPNDDRSDRNARLDAFRLGVEYLQTKLGRDAAELFKRVYFIEGRVTVFEEFAMHSEAEIERHRLTEAIANFQTAFDDWNVSQKRKQEVEELQDEEPEA